MKPFCCVIDWGTSRFRLWILAEDGTVMERISSNEGMQFSTRRGYSDILEHHLAAVNAPDDLPVIICGMAGSRSGWQEAKYLHAPVDLSQIAKNAVTIENQKRNIKILPGIAQFDSTSPDVMRGEETQIFGMLQEENFPLASGMKTICMPGTHSKWVSLQGSILQHFTTFMTGELFALLSEQSVLRLSIDEDRIVDPENPAFLENFRNALRVPQNVSAQLFSIRSNHLLGYKTSASGYAALSGSLIGLEFAGAFHKYGKPDKIYLMASGNLGDLYSVALKDCDIKIAFHDAESAGRNGMHQAAKALFEQANTENLERPENEQN